MPDRLPIDHDKPLNGTISAYAEHVVVCTGKDDWSSKIEDEDSGDNLAADVKELVGRGGAFADVCLNHFYYTTQSNLSCSSSIPSSLFYSSFVRSHTDIDSVGITAAGKNMD